MRAATFVAGAAWAAMASGSWGQSYGLTIDTEQSVLNRSTTVSAPFAGTFIGDWDARTNPEGTQTLPGVFGGSGNQPIDYSAELVVDGSVESAPTGGFTLSIDLPSLTASIEGLTLDLLAGKTAAFNGTVNIEYETFHTKNPTALYLGGFTIPIPLGSMDVTAFSVVQTSAASPGILFDNGDGTFTLAATVEAELTLSASFLGEPLEIPAQIVLVPIGGVLTLSAEGALLTASIEQTLSESTPLEIDPFVDLPLPLPTLLPPGGTANLLLSGTVEALTLDFSLDATLVATGSAECVPADLTCDGTVDGADLGVLLDAWGSSGPGDLDGSGEVDGADLGLLLGEWS